ncbi:hypothetical protein D3C73_1247380 [compost metagenome]
MMIMATNASVAFQTIAVTSPTSVKLTTPNAKASTAPPMADHPMPSPLGCQMTNTKVSKKINPAIYSNFKVSSTVNYST